MWHVIFMNSIYDFNTFADAEAFVTRKRRLGWTVSEPFRS